MKLDYKKLAELQALPLEELGYKEVLDYMNLRY